MDFLKSKSIFKIEKEKSFQLLDDKRKPKIKDIVDYQNGTSVKKRDKVRKALPPGKRISKSGNVYYEYRKNRTDLGGNL